MWASLKPLEFITALSFYGNLREALILSPHYAERPAADAIFLFFFQSAHLNSVAGPETASDLPGCDCFNLNDTQKLLFYCKFITRANEVRFRK